MERPRRVLFTMVVLIFLIVGIYVFSDWFSKSTGYVLGEDQKIAFAGCLKTKDVVFYLTENCPMCEKQEKLFGESAWKYVKTKVCDSTSKCGGLRELPAWEIEGKFYYGFLDFEQLDKASICDITKTN